MISPSPEKAWRADDLRVAVYATRAEMGAAAAAAASAALTAAIERQGFARVILASAPSQDELVAGLVAFGSFMLLDNSAADEKSDNTSAAHDGKHPGGHGDAKGGAIALGHPLGASGGRLLGTLAARLREGGDRYGVAAICIGVGQALAVVLENVG